ncbi:hypothetical protein LguiA_016264 [Lonicera macranthoides]
MPPRAYPTRKKLCPEVKYDELQQALLRVASQPSAQPSTEQPSSQPSATHPSVEQPSAQPSHSPALPLVLLTPSTNSTTDSTTGTGLPVLSIRSRHAVAEATISGTQASSCNKKRGVVTGKKTAAIISTSGKSRVTYDPAVFELPKEVRFRLVIDLSAFLKDRVPILYPIFGKMPLSKRTMLFDYLSVSTRHVDIEEGCGSLQRLEVQNPQELASARRSSHSSGVHSSPGPVVVVMQPPQGRGFSGSCSVREDCRGGENDGRSASDHEASNSTSPASAPALVLSYETQVFVLERAMGPSRGTRVRGLGSGSAKLPRKRGPSSQTDSDTFMELVAEVAQLRANQVAINEQLQRERAERETERAERERERVNFERNLKAQIKYVIRAAGIQPPIPPSDGSSSLRAAVYIYAGAAVRLHTKAMIDLDYYWPSNLDAQKFGLLAPMPKNMDYWPQLFRCPESWITGTSNLDAHKLGLLDPIKLQNVTRLCHTKSIVTVNGRFPGPRIIAREGDRLVIKVVNHVQNNISIHWHGIRQLRSGWADGPAYITQCPIQTGQSYVYNFTVVGQRGTFFWHAHISWLRSTLYGPLVILPKLHVPYPFPKPHQQIPIVFGEWFNTDTEAIINQALQTGGGPNVSDAYTINGLPGPLYNCSAKDTFKLMVKPGKTYLLRLVNAALNDELFFSIANHTLKIVDVDAIYVKPFETDTLVITPGQTTNVLLTTKPHFPNSTFYMMARPYATGQGTFDNSTVAALLEYESPSKSHTKNLPLFKPTLPALNDSSFAANFSKKLLSLASAQFPANVPQKVDKQFFFTVGLGTNPCDQNQTCQGPNGTKFAASINNISFAMPTTALLQSHFSGQSNGVYSPMFPVTPLNWFNYTGNPPNNTMVSNGTKVMVLPYNTSVELVMQDTSILGAESHPLHLHGFNFFIVGQGFGNYDANKDPKNFNLVDPIERNTVGVPSGGWVAIRFLADNPGVWFMHCHLEVHTSWGLKMAWLVLDGKLANQKLLPPPADLPKC